MTHEPPASLVQLWHSPYLSQQKYILPNLFPGSISVLRLFLSATLFHVIIVGDFAKLKKRSPSISVPVQSRQMEGEEGLEQGMHCSGGSGDVLRDVEKQIQHSHEDEELEWPCSNCAPQRAALWLISQSKG